MKSKILNPKSYTIAKYLLTISMLFFYILCFIILIVAIKQKDNTLSDWLKNNYLKLSIIMILAGIVFGSVYFGLRLFFHIKSEYKYNKKELIYVIVYLFCFSLLIIFGFLLTFSYRYDPLNAYVLNFVFIVFIFVLGITISILETLSRIKEQAVVNRTWFEANQNLKVDNLEKKEQIIKTQKLLNKDKNPFMEDEND
ncbi:hypothetical protein SGLAD_v1c04730 [Spiroplasma gladiatoris]|uniref:Transmembrane protein n=1 Tax=Spiroplasma gladiatoris TaxID=2143 RepID=A0A4P7AHK1_9MOLU|nr:MFS transporter [Spiroplasma gladiatoris]QBQ07672.1 hypothetical protein SGLAD_v1c04730 [Spiroplasma gladiatoris]